jgi:hypothetical protein
MTTAGAIAKDHISPPITLSRISKKNRQYNGQKKMNQGFLLVKLKSSLRKFYGRLYDLVDCYGMSVLQMTTDMFHLS